MKSIIFFVWFVLAHENDVSQRLKKALCMKIHKKFEHKTDKKAQSPVINDALPPCIPEPLIYSNQAIALVRGLERCTMIMKHVHPEKNKFD
ncbi:MAG: hypothetical protein BWY54_00870 [Candidatus Dependentiae bacterium ADurb.Bin331]|nr:MAG: hypothetical protein BWY54_00870 [Candidatus Dependentiae bacterium ADurb.Bin331]